MPSYTDNRLGWNHEIDSFAKTFMAKMGKVVDKWAQNIAKRNGLIIDRIDERIQELEDKILVREAILTNLDKEIEVLDGIAKKKNSEMKKLLDEAARYKVAANKFRMEKDNLEKLKPGTAAYKEQENRLKQFEPKYKKWLEITQKAEAKLKESQEYSKKKLQLEVKRKNATYEGKRYNLQTLSMERRYQLNQLKKDKELLEDAVANNMDKHRVELVKAFSNPRNVKAVSGMIANTMDNVLNGALRYYDEFSENEIFQLMEEVFEIVLRDEPEKFNFLKVLSQTKKNYSEMSVGGKTVKVFDMDNISTDDMMRVFSGWLRLSVGNVTKNALKKLKDKREMFVPEQQEDGDDETRSLYDRAPSQEEVPDDKKKKRRKTRGIPDDRIVKNYGTQVYWDGLEEFLKRNIDAITRTVNNALQKQLPPKSYFRRIGEQQAFRELKAVMQKIINACSSELRNGNVAFNRLRDFTKVAIGGVEDGEVFNLIYTVIRAALEYYVVSKMGNNILKDVKGLRRDETTREMALLQILNQKRNMSEKALRDYRTVKYASRSHRIACNIVDRESFDDPEEVVQKLIKATQQMEDKIDFLLDDIPVTEGSGKHNEFVNTRPLRNTGDYGA